MDINKFIALITEDKERHVSETGLAKKTGVPRGTIHHWLKELKTEPKIDMLNKFTSNVDATIERKRLYYEYCGYPVPSELFTDVVPETPKNESDFSKKELEHLEKYKSLDKYGHKAIDTLLNIEVERLEAEKEALKNRKKINLPDGAVAFVFPDNNDNTTKTS